MELCWRNLLIIGRLKIVGKIGSKMVMIVLDS